MKTHLQFITHIAKGKPNTIMKDHSCPFCRIDELEHIIDKEDTIILLKNKFPTLKDTFQTVLIETNECESELSLYGKDHLYKLIRFGINHWLKLKQSGEYKSVIFFKNHGPLSGGSIRHPHMQIVGLKDVDCNENVRMDHFKGVEIVKTESVEFNISTEPRMGFYEFNILLNNKGAIHDMADYIQLTADYILNHYHFPCNSYNLFFYHIEGKIVCKVVPRFITTPVFVGYSIPHVASNLEEVVERIREIYFN